MVDSFEPKSPFICTKHNFKNDPSKSLAEQEEALYQHQRDVEHTFKVSKKCENCGTKLYNKEITTKVPQPTSGNSNPRSPIIFCDDKCRGEYLKKLGVNV